MARSRSAAPWPNASRPTTGSPSSRPAPPTTSPGATFSPRGRRSSAGSRCYGSRPRRCATSTRSTASRSRSTSAPPPARRSWTSCGGKGRTCRSSSRPSASARPSSWRCSSSPTSTTRRCVASRRHPRGRSWFPPLTTSPPSVLDLPRDVRSPPSLRLPHSTRGGPRPVAVRPARPPGGGRRHRRRDPGGARRRGLPHPPPPASALRPLRRPHRCRQGLRRDAGLLRPLPPDLPRGGRPPSHREPRDARAAHSRRALPGPSLRGREARGHGGGEGGRLPEPVREPVHRPARGLLPGHPRSRELAVGSARGPLPPVERRALLWQRRGVRRGPRPAGAAATGCGSGWGRTGAPTFVPSTPGPPCWLDTAASSRQ